MTRAHNIVALLSLIAVKVGCTPEEVKDTLKACEKVVQELSTTNRKDAE